MSEDHRKHPRVEEKAIITVEEVPIGEDFSDRLNELPCWLEDLSEYGARLRVPSRIAPYASVVVHLSLDGPEGGDVYLRAAGECRWVEGGENGAPFTIGVEFLELGDRDLETLRTILVRRAASS
jgi:hypothetical protein